MKWLWPGTTLTYSGFSISTTSIFKPAISDMDITIPLTAGGYLFFRSSSTFMLRAKNREKREKSRTIDTNMSGSSLYLIKS